MTPIVLACALGPAVLVLLRDMFGSYCPGLLLLCLLPAEIGLLAPISRTRRWWNWDIEASGINEDELELADPSTYSRPVSKFSTRFLPKKIRFPNLSSPHLGVMYSLSAPPDGCPTGSRFQEWMKYELF